MVETAPVWRTSEWSRCDAAPDGYTILSELALRGTYLVPRSHTILTRARPVTNARFAQLLPSSFGYSETMQDLVALAKNNPKNTTSQRLICTTPPLARASQMTTTPAFVRSLWRPARLVSSRRKPGTNRLHGAAAHDAHSISCRCARSRSRLERLRLCPTCPPWPNRLQSQGRHLQACCSVRTSKAIVTKVGGGHRRTLARPQCGEVAALGFDILASAPAHSRRRQNENRKVFESDTARVPRLKLERDRTRNLALAYKLTAIDRAFLSFVTHDKVSPSPSRFGP